MKHLSERKSVKRNLFATFVLAIGLMFCFQNVSAQITITLPKFPKLKKEKPKTENTQIKEENQTTNDNNQPKSAASGESKKEAETQPVKQDECKAEGVMYVFLQDAEKQLQDIESFTPGRGWFVRSMNYSPIYYAVSPKARQERYADSALIKCQNLLDAYDKLGAAAAKKLPQFVPDKAEYPATTPANANLMKGKITNLADHKIFYIGVREANWLIDKNDYGLPTARFKHGLVWVRYTPDDHPYCRIYYINLVQDYAGGGTYGATYGNYVGETLAGCPTTK